ncbi:MAG: pyrrolo-quinoline quinone, partial [Bryobacteraceae bacterium]
MYSFAAFGQTNVLTYHNDLARTGQNLSETTLTPQNVRSATFGKLFTVPMDGKVDAQPLIVSGVPIPGHGYPNVVFAATEHDSVYAFDAANGTVYWHVSLLQPGETPSDN